MRVGRVETKEGIFYAEFSDDTARLLEKEPFEEIARTGEKRSIKRMQASCAKYAPGISSRWASITESMRRRSIWASNRNRFCFPSS